MAEQKGQGKDTKSAKPLQGVARVAALEKKVETMGGQIGQVLNMVNDLVNRQPDTPAKSTPAPQMPYVHTPAAGIAAPPGMKWDTTSGIQNAKQTFVDPSYKPQMIALEPLPPDWVSLKDQVLHPEFGLEAEQFSDRPYIQVHVIVPDKFSNVPPEQRPIKKYDRRSLVVSQAAALTELSQWFNKIRANLRETQAVQGRVSPLSTI